MVGQCKMYNSLSDVFVIFDIFEITSPKDLKFIPSIQRICKGHRVKLLRRVPSRRLEQFDMSSFRSLVRTTQREKPASVRRLQRCNVRVVTCKHTVTRQRRSMSVNILLLMMDNVSMFGILEQMDSIVADPTLGMSCKARSVSTTHADINSAMSSSISSGIDTKCKVNKLAAWNNRLSRNSPEFTRVLHGPMKRYSNFLSPSSSSKPLLRLMSVQSLMSRYSMFGAAVVKKVIDRGVNNGLSRSSMAVILCDLLFLFLPHITFDSYNIAKELSVIFGQLVKINDSI